MPVSTDRLTPTGGLFLVAESASYPSASVDGTLVYLDQTGRGRQLVWRDRSGNKLGLIGQSQPFMYHPELSPDGRRVAVRAWDADSWNLWVHDVDRPLKTRLTFEERSGQGINPLWSLSGSQIFFLGLVEDQEGLEILSIPADGSGKARALIPSYPDGKPLDWSPDEKYLLVSVLGSNRAGDIEYLERKDDKSSYEVVAFLKEPFDERGARFSPDGRFVAYSSNESGRKEVYVRRFPDGGGKRQVSESGGMKPRWSRNGKELFYFDGDWLVVIPITTSPTFSVGSPRRLFRSAGLKEGLAPMLTTSRPTASALSSRNRWKTRPHRPSGWSRTGSKPSTTSSDSGHHNEPRHAAPSRRLEGLTRLSVPTASRFGPQEPSIWPSK